MSQILVLHIIIIPFNLLIIVVENNKNKYKENVHNTTITIVKSTMGNFVRIFVHCRQKEFKESELRSFYVWYVEL